MKKLFVFMLLFVLIVIPITAITAAEDEPEPIAVAGSFDYVSEGIHQGTSGNNTYFYKSEDEVWTGSFEGVGDAIYSGTQYESGRVDVWIETTITGTVLGDKEGTMVLLLIGDRPISNALEAVGEWYGHWYILRGEGDLEHIYGQGIWWGQGGRAPEGVPDIFYTGEVVIFDE